MSLQNVYFPDFESLYQRFFDFLRLQTVYERIEHRWDQTVHGGDDGAGLAAQLKARVRGDVNETARHVIEAGDRDLRNTRGQDFVMPVVLRDFQHGHDYGGV